ncbi:MAG: hypothetical protein JXC31_06130 [Acholeplasmataceae bacterium]|nr:hypothetical protein [Acholeplasmataceae bacterium]
MKKFILYYVIFSIVMLAFIFLFTIIQESNKRSLDLFYELADDALESNNLDEFIKYQSIAYQKIDQIETSTYTFHIYQVIAKKDDVYSNQFSIFVVPKIEISSATSLNDLNDQTGIIITDSDTSDIVYQTAEDSSYTDYAISYGIRRIGFYYYAIDLDETRNLDIICKDYDSQTILSTSIALTYIAYNPSDLGTLSLGYNDTEIENLLNLRAYIQPALLKNITIFLVVDILVGAIIYFILKKKILK